MQTGNLDSQLVTMFILSTLAMGVGALAFFAKNWMKNLNETIRDLSANIHELTSTLNELKTEQEVQKVKLYQQHKDIQVLQSTACMRPECANKIAPRPLLHEKEAPHD